MFYIVVAMDCKRGIGKSEIGKNGGLAWGLKKDMAFFKAITQSHSKSEMLLTEEKFGIKEILPANSNSNSNSNISSNISNNIATESTVIMGRHTWLSIPEKFRPLAKRQNIVLSRSIQTLGAFGIPEAIDFSEINSTTSHVCSDLESALKITIAPTPSPIFVIGGGQVYQNAIKHPECYGLYITQLEKDYDCDVYFPEIPSDFKKIKTSEIETEGSHQFQFQYYQSYRLTKN